MVAKPRALSVQRHDERVGVLQFQERLLRARTARQQVGELTVEPLDQRGPQQQAPNLARLGLEHLGHQVFPDCPISAGELGHEPLGIRMTAERDHRQTQAGRPALRAPVQRGRARVGQGDLGRRKQFARLALGEPEVAGPQLANLIGKPELVKPDRRIPAGRQHYTCGARQKLEQMLELRERVG